MFFLTLPIDIYPYISKYLELSNITSLRETCKTSHDLFSKELYLGLLGVSCNGAFFVQNLPEKQPPKKYVQTFYQLKKTKSSKNLLNNKIGEIVHTILTLKNIIQEKSKSIKNKKIASRYEEIAEETEIQPITSCLLEFQRHLNRYKTIEAQLLDDLGFLKTSFLFYSLFGNQLQFEAVPQIETSNLYKLDPTKVTHPVMRGKNEAGDPFAYIFANSAKSKDISVILLDSSYFKRPEIRLQRVENYEPLFFDRGIFIRSDGTLEPEKAYIFPILAELIQTGKAICKSLFTSYPIQLLSEEGLAALRKTADPKQTDEASITVLD